MKRLISLKGRKIDISGPDGNAFALLGKVKGLLRQCDVSPTLIQNFMDEAMSDDYDHLCETVTRATDIELVFGNDSEYL